MDGLSAGLLSNGPALKAAYIVEVLCGPHDIRRLLIFVVLHPALPEEFPARVNR